MRLLRHFMSVLCALHALNYLYYCYEHCALLKSCQSLGCVDCIARKMFHQLIRLAIFGLLYVPGTGWNVFHFCIFVEWLVDLSFAYAQFIQVSPFLVTGSKLY